MGFMPCEGEGLKPRCMLSRSGAERKRSRQAHPVLLQAQTGEKLPTASYTCAQQGPALWLGSMNMSYMQAV